MSECTPWKTACPNAATCLEVSYWVNPLTGEVGLVGLRDSTDPTGPTLEMSPAEWDTFLEGAKAGVFDLGTASAGR